MYKNDRFFDADELLNEVLATEPDFSLPDNFADKLTEQVERRFAWKQYLKEFTIYLAAIIGIGLLTAAMTFICYEADWSEWQNFILSNIGLVAGINLLLVFVLFADRVLLRYFMHKTSSN